MKSSLLLSSLLGIVVAATPPSVPPQVLSSTSPSPRSLSSCLLPSSMSTSSKVAERLVLAEKAELSSYFLATNSLMSASINNSSKA
ncbi:hypothetical protein B0T21DRAFT_37954 [Apiosordaria backusii]|uniref:Secreted protein n=1 Tax=Apiosordaria backusii TaxID=314023 RepID=A0AA40E797_9PEZI|nr:hypothetical protein B0T21DRAFT_37954 [Apiosordaria backusii]